MTSLVKEHAIPRQYFNSLQTEILSTKTQIFSNKGIFSRHLIQCCNGRNHIDKGENLRHDHLLIIVNFFSIKRK